MSSLKEEAKEYEPPQTLNVADLERVPIDFELMDRIANEGTPDEFKYKYMTIDGKDYRVPGSVIGAVKALLEKIPTLKFVQVLKSGVGLNTRYQVIPITV